MSFPARCVFALGANASQSPITACSAGRKPHRETFMKKLAICFAMFALTVSVAAAGQSASDTSIMSFWDKFKAAVIKGDKEVVFAMSSLPINLGFGMRDIKTQPQFTQKYRYVFAEQTDAAKCFRTAKPQSDTSRPKEFTVACPFAKDSGGDEPFVYTFKLTRLGWRFVKFENINE
jgi:hypothetical protein